MFGNDWDLILSDELNKPYFKELMHFVNEAYRLKQIYPPKDQLLAALRNVSYADVKVVIIGQDPYYQKGLANGLSFSVNKGVAIPKSLMNIYKELKTDIGCPIPNHGDLTGWTRQGVLLLNTVLTVQEQEPGSHRNIGWEVFTDEVIRNINKKTTPIVYLIWGNDAHQKKKLITNPCHAILCSAHPSPLSAYRGFFGNQHFSKTNQFLESKGILPINWQITNI
jgi:uracil-DNA glycosylase